LLHDEEPVDCEGEGGQGGADDPRLRAPYSEGILGTALRSILTYLAVGLYVLVVGPPLLLVAFLTKRAGILYRAGHLGVRLGLALSGIRTHVDGLEHLQRNRAAVYAVNHTSNVEPPIIFDALSELFPRLRILYKAELRKLPVLVRAFDLAGFVPLERGNREQSLPAIDRAAQALREGNSFLIFPEGTRSRTGELLPFKKGGFIMAVQAQAPVVPIAISGARDAMQKGSLWIRPVTVTVRFGPPIETAGLTVDDRDALIFRVRSEVVRLLEVRS
jgi:1-acyl-sn-glycerol-3-phosphate acyltransferase